MTVKAGVYRYHGRYYLFDKLMRNHYDDSVHVSYIPLWVDPAYTGPRTSFRTLEDFTEKFEYVGETYEGEPVDDTHPPCEPSGES